MPDQDVAPALGRALQAARRTTGMTQATFAVAVGVTRGSIGQFEQGAVRPRYETAARIVSVLRARRAREGAIADLERALAEAGIEGPGVATTGEQITGGPPRKIDFMDALSRPHRVAAVLLRHLRADRARWERFCIDYEVFCVLAEVSAGTARLTIAFLRETEDLRGIIEWSDGQNAADTRLLLHACAYSLAPVEYAGGEYLRLSVPLRGTGWDLQDTLFSRVPMPPTIAAEVDEALRPEQ